MQFAFPIKNMMFCALLSERLGERSVALDLTDTMINFSQTVVIDRILSKGTKMSTRVP